MQRSVIEVLVGAIVLVLCALFVFVVYRSSSIDDRYKATYTLKASFERADGIDIGSDVNVSGVNVGKIVSKELDINNYSALVLMKISQSVTLPKDTSAEITSVSLLGDKYLALVPGAESEMLKDGDSVEFTQSSVSLEGLIGKLMFGLNSQRSKSDNDTKASEDSTAKNSKEE